MFYENPHPQSDLQQSGLTKNNLIQNNGQVKSPEFKIILVGNSGVGKTCLALRASKDLYHEQQNPTIGFAFQKLYKIVDNQRISLFLWDTAGQERYKSIIQMYYRGAHCAVVVYDITSRVRSIVQLTRFVRKDSFEGAKQLVLELKRNEFLIDSYFILVGNKIDMASERQVPQIEGWEYASSQDMQYAEVSARINLGVHELFELIAKKMLEKHAPAIKRYQEQINLQRNIKLTSSQQGVDEGTKGGCMINCFNY